MTAFAREIYSEDSISAAVYDLQTALACTESAGDIDFYRAEAARATRILELGVGTGAYSLAARGIRLSRHRRRYLLGNACSGRREAHASRTRGLEPINTLSSRHERVLGP